jgi:hypothetical protein
MKDFSLFPRKYYAIYWTRGFNEAVSLVSKLFFMKYFYSLAGDGPKNLTKVNTRSS